MIGGQYDRDLVRQRTVVLHSVENLTEPAICDFHCIAVSAAGCRSPATRMTRVVGVGNLEEREILQGARLNRGDEAGEHARSCSRVAAGFRDRAHVDFVAPMIHPGSVERAICSIPTAVANREAGLSHVERCAHSTIVGYVENARLVNTGIQSAVVDGLGCKWCVTCDAVLNCRWQTRRLPHRTASQHAEMIGNRDRLGVIAARIIGVGRDISESLEIRELDRRGLNERLKVIAAPSVDADGDNVLDLRYGEADRCYRHKYDQRKEGGESH